MSYLNTNTYDNLVDEMTNTAFNAEYETPQEVIDYIDEMKYAKILLGSVPLSSRVDWRQIQKGQMKPEARELFRHINKICQFPPCRQKSDTKLGKQLKRTYSYAIRRYVLYMSEAGVTAEDFKVDGILMLRCIRNYFDELDKEDEDETNVNEVEDDEDDLGADVDQEAENMDGAEAIQQQSRAAVTPQAETQPIVRDSLDRYHTIENFKYALVHLQLLLGVYEASHVRNDFERSETIKRLALVPNLDQIDDFAKFRREMHHRMAKENFHNKDRPELAHGIYTEEILGEMIKRLYDKTLEYKPGRIYSAINTGLELLLGHHLLLRSINKRNLELSDAMFTTEICGSMKVPILGFKITQSKTMSGYAAPRKMGCCRNKRVELCLVGAFALSLWYRFDFEDMKGSLTGKHFPDFLKKESWYPIKVLFSKNNNSLDLKEPISYKYECSLISNALRDINFQTPKRGHLGRLNQAQVADAKDIEEAQISRAGLWKTNNVLRETYLRNYPFAFILSSGGFQKLEPYFIARDITPPLSLQEKIFPWLESVKEQVAARTQDGMSNNERDDTVPKFLDMLQDFRSIILQDLCVLMELVPDTVYSQHPIVNDEQFKVYKESVLLAHHHNTVYSTITTAQREGINKIVPDLAAKIDSLHVNHQHTNDSLFLLKTEIGNRVTSLEQEVKQVPMMIEESRFQVRGNMLAVQNDVLLSMTRIKEEMKSMVDNTVKEAMERFTRLFMEQFKNESLLANSRTQRNIERCIHELDKRQKKKRIRATLPNGALLSMLRDSSSSSSSPAPEPDPEPEPEAPTHGQQQQPPNKQPPKNKGDRGPNTNKKYVPGVGLSPLTKTVPDLFEEWYESRPGSMSIVEKDQKYGIGWRQECNTKYKRLKSVIMFMEDERIKHYPGMSRKYLANCMEILRKEQKIASVAAFGTRLQYLANKPTFSEKLADVVQRERNRPTVVVPDMASFFNPQLQTANPNNKEIENVIDEEDEEGSIASLSDIPVEDDPNIDPGLRSSNEAASDDLHDPGDLNPSSMEVD